VSHTHDRCRPHMNMFVNDTKLNHCPTTKACHENVHDDIYASATIPDLASVDSGNGIRG
ncbi:hypothetical protein BaRGS_00026023, partial [Batillaria attramentaria]